MVQYRYFHIDAFTDRPLKGNQAAVMPMNSYPDDEILQAIAAENNFSETAFIVQTGHNCWDLRWFTPAIEVPLCGHATLASAHVLFNHLGFEGQTVQFDTKSSGKLSVVRTSAGLLEMDFPAAPPQQCEPPAGLVDALGAEPVETWSGPFILAAYDDEETIHQLTPDIQALATVTAGVLGDAGNIICSAPGSNGFDVVSRFFAPGSGIDEDAATGSAHCIIAPLYFQKLGKIELNCHQAFPGRGAVIHTRLEGDRVKLIGAAATVVEGVFFL